MNRSNKGASTNAIQICLDIVVIVLSFLCAVAVTNEINFYENPQNYMAIIGVFIIIYILANKDYRVYNITTFFYTDRILRRITRSFITAALSITTLIYYVSNCNIGIRFYIVFIIVSYCFLVANTFILRKALIKINNDTLERTVFLGRKNDFEKFQYFLDKTSIRMNLIGYIQPNSYKVEEGYLGGIGELENIIREHNVDQIYIMQKTDDLSVIHSWIGLCVEMGVTVRIVYDFYKPRAASSYVSSIGTYPVMTYHTVSLNNLDRILKRLVDIIGSFAGIILSSPFMLGAAIAIKLDSPGPVIFKQTRVGMNGRNFHIYKFRTMYIDAEERKKELMSMNEVDGGLMFKIKDDPRITKVGNFLRKTSIDELPQFFNVFFGSMSLVGTRPPTLDEVEKYNRNHWRRISIKPGITGMWQVSGRSQITSFDEIVQLDVSYIDNWNILTDFRVMLKTIVVIFSRKGAY